MVEILYSRLNEIDIPLIQAALNNTSFDFSSEKNGVVERKIEGTYFYFVFTEDDKLIKSLRFVYNTRLEPIQMFSIQNKPQQIICFKGTRKLKHGEVEFIISQMAANGEHFRIPEEAENLTVDDYVLQLSTGINLSHETQNPSPEELLGVKLMFISGFLHHIGFQIDKALKAQKEALKLALEMVGKPRNEVLVSDIRKIALKDEYYNRLFKI